jgi:hypothetical protein
VNTQYLFKLLVLTRKPIQDEKHMYYESLVLSERFQFLQQFLLRRVSGKSSVGHKYRTVIMILPSPCGPRQSIQIPRQILYHCPPPRGLFSCTSETR